MPHEPTEPDTAADLTSGPSAGRAGEPLGYPASALGAETAVDTAAGGTIVTPPPPSPRALTFSVGVLASAVLVAILMLVPTPYAISGPGPTRDTLGEVDGVPLIEIEGTPTYDSTGELRLTTVSVVGGPGSPARLPDVVAGWFDPDREVVPVEQVFPPEVSQQEIDEENQAQMVSSQENATVAALQELGYVVPATLTVAGTVEGTGAVGVLEEGDVVVSLQGEPLETYTELLDVLAATDPGTTVDVGILRDGEPLTLQVVTGEREGGGSLLGVYVDPTFDLPVDVTIQISDIGGPSAGTMFALGIIDKLTPEDEANGVSIAGTGTMEIDGSVGPIGGIAHKLDGAVRDGATWFIAPESNCEEVVGNVPAGLSVVAVSTLHEAREAMTAIGAGDGESLPACEP